MKFRNPETGEVLDIRTCVEMFCDGKDCDTCPMFYRSSYDFCSEWSANHPFEAARQREMRTYQGRKVKMDELISRAEAVKAALELYHTLTDSRDTCRQTKDVVGVMVWTAAAEIAQAIVRMLMELPAVDSEVVVRCSDCVFAASIPQQPRLLYCDFYRLPVLPDYYCGQGRSKGGDGPVTE